MTTITHDAVITTGEYTDKATGTIKKRYMNIGKVFTNDKGQMSLKLDALPGPASSGWISLFPVQPKEQQPAQHANPSTARGHYLASQARQQPMPDGDDIPF